MASTPGMLYVTMQPRETLPLAQFHDWYNNEHGPLRLRLPFFTNGIRYQATDISPSDDTSQKPEWLAMYEISDMKHLTEPVYTSMRPNASPREKAMLAEIAVGRNMFDLTSDRQVEGYIPLEETDFTELEGYEKNGKILVAVGMTLTGLENAQEEVDRWYETEHTPLLMKIPGWLRTRRFKTSSYTPESPTEHVTLHEYENENGLGGPEHQAAMNTPWRTIIREKYVASGWRRTYSAYYIFGTAPRDIATLSQLPPRTISTTPVRMPQASWESPSQETRTWNGQFQPAIESFITTPDNVTIPYHISGCPSPSAPTLLFSNSLLTNWTIWDPFLSTPLGQSLSKTHRIIRYNTRGRNSLPSTPDPITLNTVTTDINTLLTHLRIPRLDILIGVSLGGVSALNFALRFPEMVERFVACDFNVASSEANISAWESRISIAMADESGMKKLSGMTVDRWFVGENAEKERIREVVERNSVAGFVKGVKALYHYDLRKEPGLGGCRVPGLLVVGEKDGVLPDAMAGFAKEIGGGLEARVVKGTGHLPMVERPDEFVDAIRGFLE